MSLEKSRGNGVPTGQEPTGLVAPSLEPYEKPGVTALGTFLELTRGGQGASFADVNTSKS